ncbi:MAG: hypothetical protein P8Y65_02210 [Campylobacterales bacterium]|jgi:hypothetical protein
MNTRPHQKEHRRETPSFAIPTLYWMLELTGAYFLLSLWAASISFLKWPPAAYPLFIAWFLYTGLRYRKVMQRQNRQHKAFKERRSAFEEDESHGFDAS